MPSVAVGYLNTFKAKKNMSNVLYVKMWWGFLLNSSPPSGRGDLPLDKLAAIYLPDDFFRCIFANEKCCILIKISWKLFPKSPIDSNTALV